MIQNKLKFTHSVLGVVLLLSALFVTIPGTGKVNAQDGQTVEAIVLPIYLFMREGPGTNFAIVDAVPGRAVVTVWGYENNPADSGVWVFANTANGSRGWMLSTFLQFPSGFIFQNDLPVLEVGSVTASAPLTTASGTGATDEAGTYLTRFDANFRTGPGLNFSIIRLVAGNTPFTLLARNPQGDWLKISINGVQGWMYRLLTTVEGGVLLALPVEQVAVPVANAPAPVAATINTSGMTYFPIGLRSRPEVSTSNDYDGRLNPYTYLTRGVIYCFDAEYFTDRQTYRGGGIAVWLLHGNPQGVVFVATEAEIEAVSTGLIKSVSGFSLYRQADGSFLMTGPNTDGTSFTHTWHGCAPNVVTQKDQ